MSFKQCFVDKLRSESTRHSLYWQKTAFKDPGCVCRQKAPRRCSVTVFASRPGGRQGGRSLDVGGSAKEELQQGPSRPGRSLDLGGSAKEEASQNGSLQRPPQRSSQGQGPPQRSSQGQGPPQRSAQGQGGPQRSAPGQGPRPPQRQNSQQQRPQGGSSRPQSGRPGGGGGQQRPYQQQNRPMHSRKREAAHAAKQQEPDGPLMNEAISYPEVRVIDAKKEPVGIMPTSQALQMAMEQDVDLILLNSDVQPPLVRLAPLSKLKFEQAKKEKDQRKKQREARSDLKELRFRPNTEEHDYNVRLNHAKRHLSKGDKVKLTMRFKGREMEFQSLGKEMFTRFLADLGDDAAIQKDSSMQGNQMTLIVGPKGK